MKSRSCFFIAVRYLLGRAHEGGRYLRGAAAGIAVSLVPIIVTLIVADGMIRGIMDTYLELGTGHLQVFSFVDPDGLDDVAERVRNFDGVKGAWPEKRGMGVLVGKKGKTGASVRAIDPSFWKSEGTLEYLEVVAGSAQPQTDQDMLLGGSLAASIGAEVGDTVRLMTIRAGSDGRNIPRATRFTVSGIISSGYHELDALWCIITHEGGRRILPSDSSISSSVIVKIDNPYSNADEAAWSLFSDLGVGYSVYTWKNLLHSQYSSYESTRQMLLFIMALIVIVAAVNVSSATSMLVIERQRDIAVLKVTGASANGIAGIFLWGSFLTGLCGAIVGIAIGLLLGNFINPLIRSLEKSLSFFSSIAGGSEVKILDPGFYLETIPIVIDWFAVLLIGCFTILCSIAASLIPARRAGKLKPMDLLRKY
ncbi:MAG: ABC transporter permease [Treponema sp.]|jgi:lipoprotein-releasing system permease protein|nr:ABC transporter permease [Treponema sp.]